MKHAAKKRFGQNFLTDQAIIQSLVDAINPQPADLMVEIGPGLGALTKPLLQKLNHLHAVEIDRDIIEWMQKAYPTQKITIHNSDVLKFDFSTLAKISSSLVMDARQQGGGEEIVHKVQRRGDNEANNADAPKMGKLRVVGNLPYNISSPILFHLLENTTQIIDMHFMLQKEVVERMVAAPSTPDYGRLSVMLQYKLQMDYLITVPPEAFDPAPKVESAFVRCVPYAILPFVAKDEVLFAKVVQAAFGQRRKTLRNTLKGMLDDDGFAQLAIDSQLRAENLSVQNFVQIANFLIAKNSH
ncbi:MAG TPA: 16S rRNA (adenine(1518)-N(6)/adenine(1519)-N(6))-dimethyltransferase RsmA [Methylotenera sp.]|nr:16S rRNA (adenine(1518)-N(6)/adenine(1519)-N(6))-dimethyltransferase RsmA [Methylotenera sp.]HPH06004.1 16S rRNA (adenine(1518)-N(6)/adenine(1519)-N(6))-dimethyltransferase RsmA [Methylotenera sp.]HPN00582.1 16S rRNA (adenine(1518)-N(6)/adenine(1519)-N(6))-dimethyltransferase RsmA [Methylotenera sp.]